MRHGERGQVLPLWIGAILTALALTYLALDYGNAIRYQVRAQNSADAMAQALLVPQTERWNMMMATLYASEVEEYRIRHLLDGMLLALNETGGCQVANSSGTNTCDQAYQALRPLYNQAVQRYTTDVMRLNDVTSQATYASWQADLRSTFAHISSAANCNASEAVASIKPDGGDCVMKYTLNGIATRSAANGNTALQGVGNDAFIVFVPNMGSNDAALAADAEASWFAPGMVDVVTCVKVPPLVPNFGPFKMQPYYAIGRAGATAVAFEQDWMQPGAIVDPVRGSSIKFQPPEAYVPSINSGKPYDWFATNFGGNTFSIQAYTGPQGQPLNEYGASAYLDDMSAFASWWSSIPVDPRTVDKNTVSVTSACPP